MCRLARSHGREAARNSYRLLFLVGWPPWIGSPTRWAFPRMTIAVWSRWIRLHTRGCTPKKTHRSMPRPFRTGILKLTPCPRSGGEPRDRVGHCGRHHRGGRSHRVSSLLGGDAEASCGCSRMRFAESEPVIHLVNDYDRDLFNGSLGALPYPPADSVVVYLIRSPAAPLARH